MSGSMNGSGAGRITAVRARVAARLLAVFGCVVTAKAQVGTSSGAMRRSPLMAGEERGKRSVAEQGCPSGPGQGWGPVPEGRERGGPPCRRLEEVVRALRRVVGKRAASRPCLVQPPLRRSRGISR